MADLILFHHAQGLTRGEQFMEGAGSRARAELFLYPGSAHLFTDSSLPEYEPESEELVLERTLGFLERHG